MGWSRRLHGSVDIAREDHIRPVSERERVCVAFVGIEMTTLLYSLSILGEPDTQGGVILPPRDAVLT